MPLDRGYRPRPRRHCVRWGHSSHSPKGQRPPIFGPCLSWRNGWLDQDATWYGGRPWPRRHCVRWGSSSPNKGHSTAHLSAHVYSGQTAGWIKMPLGTVVDLGPGHIVLDGDSTPTTKGHSSPLFSPMSIVAKRSPI